MTTPINTIPETYSELDSYLEGSKFSDVYKLDISPFVDAYAPQDRLTTLDNFCSGKNVLHLGCTDHIGLIDDRIENDQHLHARLTKSCKKCLGLDINDEAIAYLIEKHNIDNIINLDILADELPVQITDHSWDYILLGEMLEHVDNPVEFLNKLRERFGPYCQKIIVTVPNAFSHSVFKKYKKSKEEDINSDHRYWFTPFTLMKVFHRAGLAPESLIFSNPPGLRWYIRGLNLLRRLLGLKLLTGNREHLAATLIGIAKMK